MLSIDNEETTNSEENKNNTNNQKAFAIEMAKLPTAQQKLLEGIEKTKVKIFFSSHGTRFKKRIGPSY